MSPPLGKVICTSIVFFFIIGLNDHRPIDASSQSVSHPYEPRVVSIDSVWQCRSTKRCATMAIDSVWQCRSTKRCATMAIDSRSTLRPALCYQQPLEHVEFNWSIWGHDVYICHPTFNQNMLIWGFQLFSLFLSQKIKKNSKKFLGWPKKDFFIHT